MRYSKIKQALKEKILRWLFSGFDSCDICGLPQFSKNSGFAKVAVYHRGVDDSKSKQTYRAHNFCYHALRTDNMTKIENGNVIYN